VDRRFLYFSLLDRTRAGYMFILAGYHGGAESGFRASTPPDLIF